MSNFSSNDVDLIINILTTKSCRIIKGDTVIIECIDVPKEIIDLFVVKIFSLEAIPIIVEKSIQVLNSLARLADKQYYDVIARNELFVMSSARHFIGLRSSINTSAFSEIPMEKMNLLLKNFIQPVHYDFRNKELNWVYFRLPSFLNKQENKYSDDQSKYYMDAIKVDYEKLAQEMVQLESLIRKTKKVRIEGPGTELCFELADCGVVKSVGQHNLPDGEIFTAPIKNSVSGSVLFNIDSTYYGSTYKNVALTFENGKVVSAACNYTDKLNELLDSDEGARFVGEFALGLNPVIDKPIGDILFDEKIHTSFHLALGNSYPEADNGNRSSIHWDLIADQQSSQGGGLIFFDGILIRKNGQFVAPSLLSLNSIKNSDYERK